MKEKVLTILIPTYNRKDALINTLKQIEHQGHLGEYKIVISDNHSDYNVSEALIDNLSPEFYDCIEVHSWPFNTGMGTNLALSFVYVDTEWCWMISDDDDILENALDVILNDAYNTHFAAVRYSLGGRFSHGNVRIQSISDFCDYYEKRISGEAFYMSMLFNMKILKPYLGSLAQYSYSCVSFMCPIIYALRDRKGELFLSSSNIINYCFSDERGWATNPNSYLSTCLGIRTLFDSTHGLSTRELLRIKKVFMGYVFDGKRIVFKICLISNTEKKKYFMKLLLPYIQGNVVHKLFWRFICRLIVFTNISPNLIYRLKDFLRMS